MVQPSLESILAVDGAIFVEEAGSGPVEFMSALREQATVLRSVCNNEDEFRSDNFQEALAQLVAMYNKTAMSALAHEEWERCTALLDRAEALTAPKTKHVASSTSRLRLHAVALNNRACYFRRRGKPRAALAKLKGAYAVEEQLGPELVEDPATTGLNICAVCVQLGLYAEGAAHAEQATQQLLAKLGLHLSQVDELINGDEGEATYSQRTGCCLKGCGGSEYMRVLVP